MAPETLAALGVAAIAGIAVFVVAMTVFAYHSSNHDEGVYLQQAAMLLEGQIALYPGELADAFHPWFFIEDGGRLYPKYTPVPAAMYAVAMALVGEPRVTLAVIAAANVFLVYRLGSMVADRRVGLVAAVVFAAAPMTLVTTSVFLPYAPTAALNLLFIVSYLRGVRDGSLRWAGVAGLAIGLAFFARPYTAVSVAAPFVLHALVRTLRAADRGTLATVRSNAAALPDPIRRNLLTGALGLLFVGVTLAYNRVLTGSPLVFPYQAFAPLDGPGFGRRRILGHSIEYTPELALEANRHVVEYLLTRWMTAGGIGSAAALAGVAIAARRWIASTSGDGFHRTASGLLAGVLVTVPLANLAFWGNYNVLGEMGDPTEGLIAVIGPIYYFDLLVPLSVFAALAAVVGWRRLSDRAAARAARFDRRDADRAARAVRVLAIGAAVIGLVLAGSVTVSLASDPIERNAAQTEKFETAYEPIESATFEDDLVFVPTPYGDWQSHPFQYLRNDPGFDGPVVYALDRDPVADFTVIDAYPDREYHRFTYQGEWTANPDQHVRPKLEALDVRRGSTLTARTTVGVPDRVSRARVRLSSETGESAYLGYGIADPGESLTVDWRLTPEGVELPGAEAAGGEPTDSGSGTIPIGEDAETVVLTITLVQPDGGTLTYRQEATVRPTEAGAEADGDGGGETTDDAVEVIWPPERSVCTLVRECGTDGTYIPDDPDAHLDGVDFEATVRATE
ncbi:glycosyltransferase family 39 protein [Halopenitus sp. POP-27]|uniref:ArnT family glycosyltransferase n=1 Tax=Halopenitus sp. POP-27 TaxID=2994425 RepID=UPI00246970A4|nr:glycosyltransferase family 39 protein [Halopenitus sp. POP-27]